MRVNDLRTGWQHMGRLRRPQMALARKIVSGEEDVAQTVEEVFAQVRDVESEAKSKSGLSVPTPSNLGLMVTKMLAGRWG